MPGAAWSKDKIILIGENFNGELGRSGQEVFVLDVSNNLVFNGACVSATAGTSGGENGSATWVRIRGNDCLNPNDSRDLAVIAQLENENGWNTENNMKIITARWWIGGFYTSDSGYFYVCYNEIGQNWYVKRIGQPSADFYQISDAALIAEIEAHDFTVTPILQPLASEKGKDRQEYYWENPAGTPHITKCVKNGSTYKWIKLK
ncbi:MAG: hypothetical protein HC831_08330 [Chloroflexia bacterium]|nr:hypothetical protein [Chloroflexia bacterium]